MGTSGSFPIDAAVAVGLWQELGGNAVSFTAQKLFVLGTCRTCSATTQIMLVRYDLDGTTVEKVFAFPKTGFGPSLRTAAAMTVPVVAAGTSAGSGRIYIVGTTDAPGATSDMITMAFDFDLNSLWSKTYSYQPTPEFDGNDTGVAITTDQPSDPYFHGLGYDFVAVLGASDSGASYPDWVTIAYDRDDGCQLMSPRRYTPPWTGLDFPGPVDIAAGFALDANGLEHPAIFSTGGSPAVGNGDRSQYYTLAYLMQSMACAGSRMNGVIPANWPRAYRGSVSSQYPYSRSVPARMKYHIKGGGTRPGLYIAGTATPSGGLDLATTSDMLTIRYDPDSVSTLPTAVSQFDFKESISSGASRADVATDMDLAYVDMGINSGVKIAVTGYSSHNTGGDTQIATLLYDNDLNPIWQYGALWPRPSGGGDDEGVSVKLVSTYPNDEAELNSKANVYVAGKTLSTGNGWDYVLLKYGAASFPLVGDPPAYKPLAWQPTLIPFYNNSAANGDDVPAKVTAEFITTPPRRIFVTGASVGAGTDFDWASWFVKESYP